MSASVVAQPETEMRSAWRPCQTVPPAQHVPSAWIRATALGERGDEHLVEHDVVEDLRAALAQQSREQRRLRAVALDQLGDAAAAERAQRGVEREAAGAARGLGRVVVVVALLGPRPR